MIHESALKEGLCHLAFFITSIQSDYLKFD